MADGLHLAHLYGVQHDEIDEFWPLIRHLIEKPLIRTGVKDFSPEDIRDAVKDRRMQCWIAHKDGKILVAAITQILCYPQRKVLGVPFVGAEKGFLDDWLIHMETLKDYGREKGCGAVRIWGRKGWLKVFDPDVERIEADIQL